MAAIVADADDGNNCHSIRRSSDFALFFFPLLLPLLSSPSCLLVVSPDNILIDSFASASFESEFISFFASFPPPSLSRAFLSFHQHSLSLSLSLHLSSSLSLHLLRCIRMQRGKVEGNTQIQTGFPFSSLSLPPSLSLSIPLFPRSCAICIMSTTSSIMVFRTTL